MPAFKNKVAFNYHVAKFGLRNYVPFMFHC